MAFDRILGHDRVRGLLARAVAGGRVPPALLFIGPDGVGKRTLALAVAQALLCESPEGGEACGRCSSCHRVGKGFHPDLTVIQPEKGSIKIEAVRDLVREIAMKPFEGRGRVFVIDDAHALTEQAQNALLKSLEEPPAGTHIVLVTSAPQLLLGTIRSRCQALRFGPLPLALLEQRLVEAAGLAPDEARLRAVVCAGSLGAALAFEGEGYRAARDRMMTVLEARGGDGLARLEAAEVLADSDDPLLVLVALRALLRDVAAARAGAAGRALLNADLEPRLFAVAAGPLGPRAVALAEAAEDSRFAMYDRNANPLLAMDVLLQTLSG
ncbi:MAG TPA: DNA polymerase III subunit delta' [Vicinamibacteria bacterium]|nr:DNA polymerase III subunit delta' [Vicinamibacteria bacterium]